LNHLKKCGTEGFKQTVKKNWKGDRKIQLTGRKILLSSNRKRWGGEVREGETSFGRRNQGSAKNGGTPRRGTKRIRLPEKHPTGLRILK